MLEKLIQQHEQDVENLNSELANAVQPYLHQFQIKYDICFSAGNGTWFFHFGDIHHKPEAGFLRQLDPILFEALEYEYDDVNELGSILQDYKIKLSSKELVYVHCNHITETKWISEKPTQLVDIAEYGLMSRKMARHILENDEIDLREW